MNIGINASYLEGRRTGIARYLANLLDNWSIEFPENRYHLYFRSEIPHDRFLERSCFVKRVLKTPFSLLNKWIFWENLFLFRQLLKDNKKIDIFFSPAYTLPFLTPCKRKVVAIFDIFYTVHPEWVPLRNRYTLGNISMFSAQKADIVLTSSHFDKTDIVKYYRIPEDKVEIIYLAAEDKFKPNKDFLVSKEVLAKYGIKNFFILCVGHIINRRLQDVLIRAFYEFQRVHKDVDLVLVGANKTYPYIDIKKIILEHGLKDSVRWINYLPEEELLPMYNAASVFVYLSLYEGESIPIKEAMACGVPVITSPILFEAIGDAGYIVNDPTDKAQIKEAMEKVLFDENLRTQMIHKGLKQASMFSWQKCARRTMEVFKRLYENSKRTE